MLARYKFSSSYYLLCHFRCTAHVTNVCEVDAMLVDARHSIAVSHGRCSIFAAGTRHLAYQ